MVPPVLSSCGLKRRKCDFQHDPKLTKSQQRFTCWLCMVVLQYPDVPSVASLSLGLFIGTRFKKQRYACFLAHTHTLIADARPKKSHPDSRLKQHLSNYPLSSANACASRPRKVAISAALGNVMDLACRMGQMLEDRKWNRLEWTSPLQRFQI